MITAKDLTLRQKIGQIALCSLDGDGLDARALAFLGAYSVGNIIHFGNNVKTFDGAKALNQQLNAEIPRHCAGVPPFISIDHEGGRVMRFGAGVTWFPSAMALGAAGDADMTRAVGQAMGRELRAAGFNANFAPVADVNVSRRNPVVGVRAFSDDPQTVASHCLALAQGLQSAGVMACLKHFPGHGDTEVDSHYGLPRVDKPRDMLEKTELYPYREAFSRHAADGVMTTHILFPALEVAGLPATMSHAILTGLLRRDMGFDGIVVTDGMQMQAIAAHYGVERGCVEAVKAGSDLLCIGTGGAGFQDVQAGCLDALYHAAQSGEIPARRLDEAVDRVLAMKRKYCGVGADMPDIAEHARLNALVCRQSVTSLRPFMGDVLTGRVLCASAPVRELAYGLSHGDPRSRSFADMASEILASDALAASKFLLDGAPLPEDFDTLLLGVASVKPDSPELSAASAAIRMGKRVAFAVVGAPYGAQHLPGGCPAVCVYCLTPQSVRAALDTLRGLCDAPGRLPVVIE